ncbi:JmjC domain-containing protein, partial [Streptomyces sp. SM12]|uniref:JmjC domain-containing protein n=1 Tax=Streptomyces sp. SM12 TaxID=1071602 RepID=UPI000CD50A99
MTVTTGPLTVLGALGWDTFAARHWDRGPVLFKGVASPPFTRDEVFACAVAACEDGRGHSMPPGVEFGVGRNHPLSPMGRLPRAEDGSWDGYARRMRDELHGERHSLVISGFHTHHHPLWQRERAFYAGLWSRVGQPLTGAITTLFHGNYSHSPVGVHKDRYATFMFALEGRKRMRFWHRRPWEHQVSTVVDYERHLPSSFTAEADPGDLLYWPASYYHVGESDLSDRPAISVNIGVPREIPYSTFSLPDLLAPARQASSPPATALHQPPGGENELPPVLRDALESVRRLTGERQGPDRRTALALEYATAGGFRPARPACGRKPSSPEAGS